MKFEQTKDIIDHAVYFHRVIKEYCEDVRKQSYNPRLHILLDYLIEHEKSREQGILEYGKEASAGIMETWFQFSTCEDQFAKLQDLLKSANPTVENVIKTTISLYDSFISQFETFAAHAEIDEVRDVFLNIAVKEKKEKLKLARNSRMLDDM